MDSSWEERGNLTVPSGSASESPVPSLAASWAPTAGLAPREDSGSASFWNTPLNQALSVFVALALFVAMLGLGCTVELSQLGAQLRRPLGLLLALLCQFGLMPLVAFLMALVFALDEVAAVTVLLCGCCPGGNLSNIMSLLVNGDMNLRYPKGKGREGQAGGRVGQEEPNGLVTILLLILLLLLINFYLYPALPKTGLRAANNQ
uniref:Solute carrier family 10 member 6 n=1 Tax=Podarcis muralis TaxID=64176 RepID=A0A670J0B2_PODMU